jgi:hypothetical protein
VKQGQELGKEAFASETSDLRISIALVAAIRTVNFWIKYGAVLMINCLTNGSSGSYFSDGLA